MITLIFSIYFETFIIGFVISSLYQQFTHNNDRVQSWKYLLEVIIGMFSC